MLDLVLSSLLLSLVALAIGTVLIFFAHQEIEEISQGRDKLDGISCLIVSTLSAFGFALFLDPEAAFMERLVICMAIFLMASMAYADRQTAWAPNTLVLPFLVCAGLITGASSAIDMTILAIAFPAGYLALGKSFDMVSKHARRTPPPADIMTFAIGIILMGFSMGYVISLFLGFIGIILARSFPDLQIFHNENAILEARKDLGYTEDMGPAIPLLAIMFPSYIIGMLLDQSAILPVL